VAVETGPPASHLRRRDSVRTGLPYRAGRQRPQRGGEFWWWLFMRVSGILLLVLAVGHVLIMHVFGSGIDRVDFGFVAVRWQTPLWRTWDWLLLSLAMIHGVNGLRVITLDYVRRPGVRTAVNGLWAIMGTVLFALGTVVVFSFDACRWPISTALRMKLHC
jgi:succinate dehydrogenase / fumarate reductase membrane anchor subunit